MPKLFVAHTVSKAGLLRNHHINRCWQRVKVWVSWDRICRTCVTYLGGILSSFLRGSNLRGIWAACARLKFPIRYQSCRLSWAFLDLRPWTRTKRKISLQWNRQAKRQPVTRNLQNWRKKIWLHRQIMSLDPTKGPLKERTVKSESSKSLRRQRTKKTLRAMSPIYLMWQNMIKLAKINE